MSESRLQTGEVNLSKSVRERDTSPQNNDQAKPAAASAFMPLAFIALVFAPVPFAISIPSMVVFDAAVASLPIAGEVLPSFVGRGRQHGSGRGESGRVALWPSKWVRGGILVPSRDA